MAFWTAAVSASLRNLLGFVDLTILTSAAFRPYHTIDARARQMIEVTDIKSRSAAILKHFCIGRTTSEVLLRLQQKERPYVIARSAATKQSRPHA
jgi:hypothetical protein